ncbi:MAG: GTP-binding protein [Bacteroidetes bacterium]|nr:GTP-binding protein [Bacteroidota bacterium]
MIKKKIAMVGAFAVGKTSLVQRFVRSIFNEKYQTTIGVKIDQKEVEIEGASVNLLLWDIHGEDDFMKVKPTYLIGSSGYFLVADSTRHETLQTALNLGEMATSVTNNVPFILLINKCDLKEEQEILEEDLAPLRKKGWRILETSAKEAIGVEEAFYELTKSMMGKSKQ